MYSTVLAIHSWIRWFALVAAVGTMLAVLGNRTRGNNSPADRWGMVAMMALDVQMLVGLILYFALSPFTQQALSNFGAAMQNAQLRFWAVEHVASMFGAVILAHVGRVLARKAPTPEAKRMRLLICFGLATILMFLATPWPGMANGRPLFRL
jgi:hypothetical protein